MKLKVLTLPFNPEEGRFDDAELATLCASCEVLSVSDHFFEHDGSPTWALLVSYRERGASRSPSPRTPEGEIALDPADKGVFEALRHWRNERAKKDGRPPYALFTNSQLAAIARSRPETRAALDAVPDVGEGKLRNYGDEILALIVATRAG